MIKNKCGKVGFKSFAQTKSDITFSIFVHIWNKCIVIFLLKSMGLWEEGGM